MPRPASRRAFLAASAAALLTARPSIAAAQEAAISGGGSNFVRPVIQHWIKLAPPSLGVKASYTVLGTGAAQSRAMSGEIDFAAVELPLTDDQLSNGRLMQLPIVFGALAVTVNVQGVKDGQLRLNGPLLAAIYSGQVKKWNDPRVAALNPGLALPDQDVRPLTLATPQGAVFSTTTTLQKYLLATNADWRAKFGDAIGTRRWYVGSMVMTATAMAENMKLLPGAIGYMALGEATAHKLTTAAMINKAGKPVAASAASLHAAVAQVDWAKCPGLVVNALDLPGAESWPIVLTTYAQLSTEPKDPARGQAVRAFLRHFVTQGDAGASERHGAGLPAAAHPLVLKLLSEAGGTRG